MAKQEQDRLSEREAVWQSICPREFRVLEEDGNTCLDRMAKDCPKWTKILEWKYNRRRGLLVRGETGRCKTRAMWRLLRRLFDERIPFIALTAGEFERGLRDAASSFRNQEWFTRLAGAKVLFLDDLGKMAATECVQSSLFSLIDERTANGNPILATTNDTGETLAARMSSDRGAPTIRRLRDYCETIVL